MTSEIEFPHLQDGKILKRQKAALSTSQCYKQGELLYGTGSVLSIQTTVIGLRGILIQI